MRKSLLVISALAMSISLLAQKNDPAAKALLDKVSVKYKSLKTVSGNYTLTVLTRSGKSAGKKSGQIFIKGNKFKITESSLQIFSDGNKIWKFEPEANEVSVSNVEAGMNGITPQKLFTNFYDKDFLYKLNGVTTMAGKKLKEIEMTPTDKRKNFFKVYVYIDETQHMIMSSRIFENSGNVYNYAISNVKTNGNLADNIFVFDKNKYPGVEVINQ